MNYYKIYPENVSYSGINPPFPPLSVADKGLKTVNGRRF